MSKPLSDVIVIGAGAVGLAIARELALSRISVLVLERDTPGKGTSWAAAGMLAPQSEAVRAGPFFDLTIASRGLFDGWSSALTGETGIDVEYAKTGVLCLAPTGAELETLERSLHWQRGAGFRLEALSVEETLKLEPGITMPIAGALWLPDEAQITPRRVIQALHESCVARGVEIRAGARVEAIASRGGRVEGVQVGGKRIPAAQVVVASGVWSPEIAGLDPPIPVYPRKGQILSLAMTGRFFRQMLRWGHTYAVPRPSVSGVGELIVGATNEEVGFDRSLTPAGIGGLLAEAQRVSSHIASFPIVDMWTGLRPASPDGQPVIGRSRVDGLIYATGHYRNGILLAPITAAIVAALVKDESPPFPVEETVEGVDAFSPSRFASGAV